MTRMTQRAMTTVLAAVLAVWVAGTATAQDPPNELYDRLGGVEIFAALDGIAASTCSACHSGRVELSPILRAIGVPERIGLGAIRFSLGRYTTGDAIDETVDRIRLALEST